MSDPEDVLKKYICSNSECGVMTTAESFEEIVYLEKLCKVCFAKKKDKERFPHLDTNGTLARKPLNRRGKSKKKNNLTRFYVCVFCNTEHKSKKPWSCKTCGEFKFKTIKR